VLVQFRRWLEANSIGLLPQAPLAKVFGYALRHWEALIGYTENGVLLPDNNAPERQIRPIALGRSNWMFAASPRGARQLQRCTHSSVRLALTVSNPTCGLSERLNCRRIPSIACTNCCRSPARHLNTMDILDSLRQAPSAELYRLYLAIGKVLDDPRRILEIRQRLHLGMAVNYIGDNPVGPPAQGTIVELRQTQAVVQDSATRRRWGVLYAAIIPETLVPLTDTWKRRWPWRCVRG
jgi:hypothetical protein